MLRPLDSAELYAAVDALLSVGTESVAVLFLHAYLNPAHEREAARLIRAYAPGAVRHHVA